MSTATIGTGLPSRMIFVYESQIEKRVVCPFFTLSAEGVKLRQKLIEDLTKIRSLKGDFKVSKDFIEFWTEWYGNHPDTCPFDPMHFGAYWSRKPSHIMKLSMVMSASRSNDKIIQASDMMRALKLLDVTEQKMSMVFGKVGTSEQADNIEKVMHFISYRKEVTMNELMKEFLMFMSSTDLDGVLSALQMSGFIETPVSKGGVTIIRYNAKNPSFDL